MVKMKGDLDLHREIVTGSKPAFGREKNGLAEKKARENMLAEVRI